MAAHDAHPSHCENCNAALHGAYCHQCGQSVHSPTRDFRHAVEDVFESFWHLDGRVFRTLRDLLVPGRIAINYLAGKRARYLPPLRLFVILSVLTFFVGKLAIHVDEIQVTGLEGRSSEILTARTIPEVERIRDQLLAELEAAEDKAGKVPGVNPALIKARVDIQGEAANRIAQLRKAEAAKAASGNPPAPTGEQPMATATTTSATDAAAPEPEPEPELANWGWDPKTDPVDVAWLPGFADRWLNAKMTRVLDNLKHLRGNENRAMQAFLGAVPTTLFLLMPLFALLLKLLYLGSGRRYLEHLVVALYSHAWLLLALMASFLFGLAASAIGATWATIVVAVFTGLLWWLAVPAYLFMTQLRVYGEHWALTAVRYLVIGLLYFSLVVTAAVFAAFAGLSS